MSDRPTPVDTTRSADAPAPRTSATCARCGATRLDLPSRGVCPRCLLGGAFPELGTRSNAAGRADRPAATLGRIDRYLLLKRLGRGAMGEVYLARDDRLDRLVALKTPQLDRAHDPEIVARFQREAQLAGELSHPNICPVYDVGRCDGKLFYTMAYIDGRPLADWIRADRPPSLRRTVVLIAKIAATMAVAHARGIVHRDLKPSNILVDRRGEPIITDFGLARRPTFDARLTRSDRLVGTPAYLAPELLGGGCESPASDIYSLGVVLYELLTGRLPFDGPLGELFAQIARDPAPPPSRLRPAAAGRLDAICAQALAKSPADRFASMDAFAAELAAILRETAAATPHPPDVSPQEPPPTTPPVAWTTSSAPPRSERRGRVTNRLKAAVVGGLLAAWGVFRAVSAPGPLVSPTRSPVERPDAPATAALHVSPAAPAASAPDSLPEPAVDRPKSPPESSPPARPASPAAAKSAPAPHVVAIARVVPSALPESVARRLDARFDEAKPTTPPQSPLLLAFRALDDLRRLDADRRRLRQELVDVAGRIADLPQAIVRVQGELSSLRRMSEAATLDQQDFERRMLFLSTQGVPTEVDRRQQAEAELQAAAAGRAQAFAQRQQLDVEIRGKLTELSRLEASRVESLRSAERLSGELRQLVDQVFWTADPAGSWGRIAYDELAELFTEWLADSGEQAELLALRAVARVNGGRAEAATLDAQRAVQLAPKSPLAIAALGYARSARGSTADGLLELNRAVRLAPSAPYAYFFRGRLNRERRHADAARADFAKALELAPQSPWTAAQYSLQLAAGAARKGASPDAADLEEAERLAREACRATDRQSWFCLETLATTLAAAERWEEAVESAETARRLAPLEFEPECLRRRALFESRVRFQFDP